MYIYFVIISSRYNKNQVDISNANMSNMFVCYFYCIYILCLLINCMFCIAALSDVNSMIDFNDGYDSNRYESRRQSSLSGSSACPYASDSLCDEDDDYNDESEFNFNDDYDVDDEKPESCDDDDFNNRHHNLHRLLQQQQMFLSQPATSPFSSGAYALNNKKYVSKICATSPPIHYLHSYPKYIVLL